MSATDKMIARKEGGVGYVIFNNPERHNAVSLEMWEATADILKDYAKDDAIRVAVLTGAGGKAFVSGADISRFSEERGTQKAIDHYNATTERTFQSVHEFPKPTIAMIRGFCMGGGLALAINCDIRIASDNSRFALPAAKLGLGYGYSGLKRFVEAVGPAFTKEIFFTARQFEAAEARDMGLVNRVLPDAEVEAYVKNYANIIAANAPFTIAAIKFIVGEALKDESKRDLAACEALVKKCFASRDYEEGRKAFMEKRKPVFTGR